MALQENRQCDYIVAKHHKLKCHVVGVPSKLLLLKKNSQENRIKATII